MNDLQDTAFWLLFIQLMCWVAAAGYAEWRKGSRITDELARRARRRP